MSAFPEMETVVYSQHPCVVACRLRHTAGWLWSSTAPDHKTGRLLGKFPFVETRFIWRERCLPLYLNVCVCKCLARCMTLLSLSGLRAKAGASSPIKNRRWRTHWRCLGCAIGCVCVCVETQRVASTVRPHKCWKSHCAVAFMSTKSILIWTQARLPLRPHQGLVHT